MTAAAIPAETGRRGAALTLRPSRDEAIDALMLLALTVIGMVGFRDAYGGHAYLIAGAAGAVLGVGLSHVGHRARLPLLAITAVCLLAFLLLGGLASQAGLAGGMPSLATMRAVVGASIRGWEQLLTTARPVGSAAHLLVLPYLLGLASGVAGHALARRTDRYLLPAAAPATVVALSILFGADHATAAVLQGAAFAGLALAWAALRQQRGTDQHTTIGRQRPWQRLGAAVAVLAVAVAGATIIGPRLPGAHAHQRVVLQVVPPFDVAAYPSPLAGFRDYTKDVADGVSVYSKQLITTTGLASGTRVRIAAMDTYDGLVWGVANAEAGTSSFGGFQRIGTTLPGAGGGPTRRPPPSPSTAPTSSRGCPTWPEPRRSALPDQPDAPCKARSASTSPRPPASSPADCPPDSATPSPRPTWRRPPPPSSRTRPPTPRPTPPSRSRR